MIPLTNSQNEVVKKEGSVCVTAGAGTGKTTVLVERYIRLVDKVPSVKNILALTFTEKAAAEMKERVRAALFKRSDDKGREIREDFNWSSISTFHSFCASVLRDYPLESGIDPGFVVLEEAERELLLQESVDELCYSEGLEIHESLIEAMTLVTSSRLRRFLLTLYGKRLQVPQMFSRLLDRDPKAEWEQMLEEHKCEVVDEFLQDRDAMAAVASLRSLGSRYAGEKDRGTQYLRNTSPLLAQINKTNSVDEICSALFSLTSVKGATNMGNKSNFNPGDLNELRESYKELKCALEEHNIETVLDIENDEFITQAIEFLKNLRSIYDFYSRIVQHRKDEVNGIDFDDMLISVHELFSRDKEFVRKHLGARYRYILVDEMQDTDIVQLEIIRAIIGKGEDAKDRLFIVGDPKQSIYLFRDVDVSLFKDTRDFIIDTLGGASVNLDVSHRSTPQVVDFVNFLFGRLMFSASRPWEFGYERIECSPIREKDEGSVELVLVPSDLHPMERKMTEAEMVASRIKEIVTSSEKRVYWDGKDKREEGRLPCFGDITILLRARTNLRFYEHMLQKMDIPYHVHAGLGFYSSQEILDVYNMLRFLHNHSDDIALYGVLRSPYFGLSDADLFRISEKGKGRLFRRLKEYANDSGETMINEIADRLERWQDYSHREPIGDFVARIISESSIYAVYGAITVGDQMIANLEKLLEMVRRMQQAGFISLSDVLQTMTNHIQEEVAEGEAQLDIEGENVVNIMTVHAAKGLEFPIVIVPEIDTKSRSDTRNLRIDRVIGLGIKIPDSKDMELRPTLPMRKIEAIMAEKETAEKKRLFYVATTRAKDHLILTGQRGKGLEYPLERGTTWMDWLVGTMELVPEDETRGVKNVRDGTGKIATLMIRPWRQGSSPVDEIEMREYEVPESLTGRETRAGGVKETEEEAITLSPSRMRRILLKEEMELPEDVDGEVDIESSGMQMTSKRWGVIVHQVFEGRKAKAVLREHGIVDVSLAAELDQMYSKFLDSELMKNVVEERKEQSFSILIDGKLVEGRIDRLVKKENGQWILIDYKTGALDGGDLEERKARYKEQLKMYVRGANAILGCDVISYLFFTDNSITSNV